MLKKTLVNRQIRAREVRVIDQSGSQLGVLPLEEALKKAQERNLDLIQVTEKVEPPVCKIMDYGKFIYQEKKKEKEAFKKQRGGELKGIRLGFNMAQHDLEVRVKQTEKFLKEGNKVRIEMRLFGREKALGEYAKKKINQFLELLQKVTLFKIEKDIKREPRGFNIIISKE